MKYKITFEKSKDSIIFGSTANRLINHFMDDEEYEESKEKLVKFFEQQEGMTVREIEEIDVIKLDILKGWQKKGLIDGIKYTTEMAEEDIDTILWSLTNYNQTDLIEILIDIAKNGNTNLDNWKSVGRGNFSTEYTIQSFVELIDNLGILNAIREVINFSDMMDLDNPKVQTLATPDVKVEAVQ